ncbi:transglutaminase-like domain-containing protein [Ferrovibrio xuzhouensis]|uniref:Transglutaminase family protein n=1 Tax=Ferrovibrio xuzhouensis TaxID=1576914 RepID=A0ABV7VAN9_9PROT
MTASAPSDPAVDPAYLAATSFIDSDHADVRALARAAAGEGDARTRAVRLYYAVRDRFLYDPYSVDVSTDGMRASGVIERGYGFCVNKAILLAALARAEGIPARLGLADVKNHLATARLRASMGTDVFFYHGFTELWLDGKWVKATPAFNIELCEKFRVLPLDFDGETDSVFHPFDADNRRHMEYIADRGSFADLPYAEWREAMLTHYPDLMREERRENTKPGGDFAAEAAAENQNHDTPSPRLA